MHRELTHAPGEFRQGSNLPLYLMTALLGALMVMDLAPRLGNQLGVPGMGNWPTGIGTFGFALIAAVIGGARVLYGALQSLLEGRIGADLALAIAAIAAILPPVNEPLLAAEIVFIGMLGECLEAFTFARTQKALHRIVEVFPQRCWLLRDGQEIRVLTSELKVGDQVVVKPGAKIPVDGLILAGRSAVDASPLTGESLPQDKGPGDEALAGSLNQFGALTIEARRVAENTVAGQVIELTARALKNKATLERTADRLARLFLPVVLGLAALTFLGYWLHFWGGWFRAADAPRWSTANALAKSIYPALSVLVVACPCALILATPAAVMAALARLAGTGILLKGGSALERLAQVSAFAFDKTGTLTEGRLELGEIIPLNSLDRDDLLRTAASAEAQSEHPLARLIVQEATSRGLEIPAVDAFQAQPGAGVLARLGSDTILVGTRRLLEDQGIHFDDKAQAVERQLDAAGQTVLWVAAYGVLLGALGARDRLRPEAHGVLEELKALGIDPILLLTGDRAPAAEALAAGLPLSAIHASLLPQQKVELVKDLRQRAGLSAPVGSPWSLVPRPASLVAMVGDGINDAPALAAADVGLVLGGTGADIAAEAGDILLMGQPLRHLPLLVRLARATVGIIRQNILIFAFAVNLVGVALTAWLLPLVAPGWLERSPVVAAVYHQIGSLLVLLNSMRLLWFERTAGPGWTRWQGKLRQADLWIEKNLDFGEAMHWLSHRWRGVLLWVGLGLVVLVAATGLVVVRPGEKAVVRRFGRPVADLEPGWHYRWPWPIEDAVRVSLGVQTIEVGFRETSARTTSGPLTWSSRHRRDNRRAEEAMMLTGDGNLVDLLATVRFRVTDPRVFLFEVENAPETLRAMAEGSLRELAAGRPFQDLLTTQRESFQREAARLLRQRCQAHGLGIEVEGVDLLDLHPPEDVVDAYDAVARAMEQRDEAINNAQRKALARRKSAQAEQAKILAQARATAGKTIRQAEGETARYLARVQARNELPWTKELALTAGAFVELLQGLSPEEVEKTTRARRAEALAVQTALSDFRIYWDAVGQALGGRELILIDADQIKAGRHLFLIDPDQLRPNWPMLMPPRPPLRPGEEEGP